MTQSSDVQGNINKIIIVKVKFILTITINYTTKKFLYQQKNGLYENIHTDRYTYTDINIQIRDVNMRLL